MVPAPFVGISLKSSWNGVKLIWNLDSQKISAAQ